MDVLWINGGWMTPSEIQTKLSQVRPLGYTTVTTIVARLCKKGRLERRRDGRSYAYHPTLTSAQWTANRMGDILAKVEDPTSTLTHFVGILSNAERTQLRRMLSDRDKK